MIKPSKLASWLFLVGFYLLVILLSSTFNFYLFDWPVLDWPARISSGLIHPNLIINWALIGVYAFVLLGLDGSKFRDFGFLGSVKKGILYTVLLWLLLHLGVALWQRVSGNGVHLRPDLSQNWTVLVGLLLGQLLGNVLLEEPFWRGFVWSQLTFKLFPERQRRRLYGAVLGSLLFALVHIPNQLVNHERGWADMPVWILNIFLMGLIFSGIFWWTRNLYVTMGFHALFNEPTLLLALPNALTGEIVLSLLPLVCGLILLPFFRARASNQISPTPTPESR